MSSEALLSQKVKDAAASVVNGFAVVYPHVKNGDQEDVQIYTLHTQHSRICLRANLVHGKTVVFETEEKAQETIDFFKNNANELLVMQQLGDEIGDDAVGKLPEKMVVVPVERKFVFK